MSKYGYGFHGREEYRELLVLFLIFGIYKKYEGLGEKTN